MIGKRFTFFMLMLISGALYFFLGFKIERTSHIELFGCFIILMFVFLIQLRYSKSLNISWLFASGLLFRLVFLLSVPRLSDDFYRFNWDGEIQVAGISAFQSTPADLYAQTDLDNLKGSFQERVAHFPNGMNSEHYYSIYPYTLQPIFILASYFSKDVLSAIVWMHVFLLLFEILSFFLLKKLLAIMKKPGSWVYLYWLNPVVIIEIMGNLHFEGLAITFLLLAIYGVYTKRDGLFMSSVVLAIGAKLTPIFILPAVLSNWGWRKTIRVVLVIVPVSAGLLLFLIGWNNLPHFWSSVLLYFEKFEFNSGIFSVLKQGLLRLTGVDYASVIRPVSTVLFTLIAGYFTFFKQEKNTVVKLLWFYMAYLFLGQIIHPWYIVLLIPLAILSERLYPIVWAFLAFFSYSAYNINGVEESLLFLAIESLTVMCLMYLEEFKKVNLYERIQKWLF